LRLRGDARRPYLLRERIKPSERVAVRDQRAAGEPGVRVVVIELREVIEPEGAVWLIAKAEVEIARGDEHQVP
jgi:hypothetical protein